MMLKKSSNSLVKVRGHVRANVSHLKRRSESDLPNEKSYPSAAVRMGRHVLLPLIAEGHTNVKYEDTGLKLFQYLAMMTSALGRIGR